MKWLLMCLLAFSSCVSSGLTPVEPVEVPWKSCDVAHLSLPKAPDGVGWIDLQSAKKLEAASHDCLAKFQNAINENANRTRQNRTAYERKDATLSDKISAAWKGALVQDVLLFVFWAMVPKGGQ